MHLMFIGQKIVILKHSETKWQTRSNDKISEVISRNTSIQSNSVALELRRQLPLHGLYVRGDIKYWVNSPVYGQD